VEDGTNCTHFFIVFLSLSR